MRILTNLDLNRNQLLNVVIQQLATAPSTPNKGQIYFNTTSNRTFIYNGSEWIGADAIGATMTGDSIITAINGSTFLIDDDNLSQGVRDAIAQKHNSHTIAMVTGLQGVLDLKETIVGAQTKATTAEGNAKTYTDTALANLVASAPGTLDTLNELAAALNDDPNFATTITNLIALKATKYTTLVGNGSLTSYVITHNLNSRDIVVMLRETASPYAQVITDVEMTTVNAITLKFAVAPTSNQYTVTIIG